MTGGSVEQVVDKLLLLGETGRCTFCELVSELVGYLSHTADKLHFHLAVAIQEEIRRCGRCH